VYVGFDTLPTWAWWIVGILAGLFVIWLLVVWRKGQPFAPGDVFRASRLSRGNRLFPTQVLITPTSVVQYTPQWIGRQEESIHMAHIASIKIDTHAIFSDIYVETSGGQDPVVCHGHTKGDAVQIKELLEKFQSEYYGRASGPGPQAPGPDPGLRLK
jgi:hypothetical protein